MSALVLTAEHDPLRDEGIGYAKRMSDAGVRVQHTLYESSQHGFFGSLGPTDDHEKGIAEITAWLTSTNPIKAQNSESSYPDLRWPRDGELSLRHWCLNTPKGDVRQHRVIPLSCSFRTVFRARKSTASGICGTSRYSRSIAPTMRRLRDRLPA